MSFILKRGFAYYVRAGNHGAEHIWTTKPEEAYRFPFRSIAEVGLQRDHRLAGAEIEEVK